jgi:hypothetical protein
MGSVMYLRLNFVLTASEHVVFVSRNVRGSSLRYDNSLINKVYYTSQLQSWDLILLIKLSNSTDVRTPIVRPELPGDRGSIPDRGKGFFLYPLCPDKHWRPPSLLSNGYRRSFPRDKARPGRGVDHSPLKYRSQTWVGAISCPPKLLHGV